MGVCQHPILVRLRFRPTPDRSKLTILRISANAYRIIPHAQITLQRRHEPGRLYRCLAISTGPVTQEHEDEDGRGFVQVYLTSAYRVG
jgi:hypothetical protein